MRLLQADVHLLLLAIEQMEQLVTSLDPSTSEALSDFVCLVNALTGRTKPRAVGHRLTALKVFGQGVYRGVPYWTSLGRFIRGQGSEW